MKLNKFYTLVTVIAFCGAIATLYELSARGGGGGGGHFGGGHAGHAGHAARGGHTGNYGHGGHGHHYNHGGRGGWGRGGYGRGGYGYGGYGYGGLGWGIGLGFALGYPGYWSDGYYYNSEPIVINNITVDPGQGCWDEDNNEWYICGDIEE